MPCGCGGSGQWQGGEDAVPADGPDPSYFWTGQPPSDEPAPAEGAKAWNPDTGRTED